MALASVANAQDTKVNAANFAPSLDQAIFMADGMTGIDSSFKVDIFGGSGTTKESLSLLTTVTITGSGYFFGSEVTVTGVPSSGLGYFYGRAYNGMSFTDASTTMSGEGQIYSTRLGPSDQSAPPVNFLASLDETHTRGFTSFNVGTPMAAVPEPTTVALGVIGGIGMLFRRRRNA